MVALTTRSARASARGERRIRERDRAGAAVEAAGQRLGLLEPAGGDEQLGRPAAHGGVGDGARGAARAGHDDRGAREADAEVALDGEREAGRVGVEADERAVARGARRC